MSRFTETLRDLGVAMPPGSPRYDVAGKVALITGGADGIGFALAELMHARGACVALIDVDASRLAAAVTALGTERVHTEVADVTDREAIRGAVESVRQKAGGVDIVVANAGITPPPATLRQIDPVAFDRVIAVNLTGTFNTIQAAADAVIAKKGHIVVLSSAAAYAPGPGGAAYMISKAAIEQLGRALRLELAAHEVTLGIAYFGFVDTELARRTLDEDPLGAQLAAHLPAPLRRRITPEQAAAVIADGIARRGGRTLAPVAWLPWDLLRGLVNIVADGYLRTHRELHALLRELEDGQRSNSSTTTSLGPADNTRSDS